MTSFKWNSSKKTEDFGEHFIIPIAGLMILYFKGKR
jgi:hypothetical protein